MDMPRIFTMQKAVFMDGTLADLLRAAADWLDATRKDESDVWTLHMVQTEDGPVLWLYFEPDAPPPHAGQGGTG
jgi:hypothetical protein